MSSEPLSSLGQDELDGYRVVLQRCREVAVATADKTIQAIMAYNSAVLARIDAALAELEPRAGESGEDHRRRIAAATAELRSYETDFGGD